MKKRSFLLKLVVFVFAVYAAVTLVQMQVQINQGREAVQQKEEELARQELKNAELKELIGSELTLSEIERIARDKLGLVRPGETIFVNS